MKLSTFKKAFGANVRNRRIEKNLTQSELAEKLGIETASLGRLECGINFVSARLLLKLCEVLETSPAQLFSLGKKLKIDSKLNDKLDKIFDLLFDCNNKQLDYIYKTLKLFLKTKK